METSNAQLYAVQKVPVLKTYWTRVLLRLGIVLLGPKALLGANLGLVEKYVFKQITKADWSDVPVLEMNPDSPV